MLDDLNHSGTLGLLYGDAELTRLALYGVTQMAVDGHIVWVLDGANSFDAYWVARLARYWGSAPETVLSRIRLSRAFTCYQMATLVTQKLNASLDSSIPAAIVCLGLLATFYDDDVPMMDAVRLLNQIITHLSRYARDGHSILITARPPRAELRERAALFDLLKSSVDLARLVSVESPTSSLAIQPSLFAL